MFSRAVLEYGPEKKSGATSPAGASPRRREPWSLGEGRPGTKAGAVQCRPPLSLTLLMRAAMRPVASQSEALCNSPPLDGEQTFLCPTAPTGVTTRPSQRTRLQAGGLTMFITMLPLLSSARLGSATGPCMSSGTASPAVQVFASEIVMLLGVSEMDSTQIEKASLFYGRPTSTRRRTSVSRCKSRGRTRGCRSRRPTTPG